MRDNMTVVFCLV